MGRRRPVRAQHALNEREGGITTRIVALHVAGFVALGRGHDDSAVRFLEEARQRGDEMGELQRFSPAMWGLAECAVLRGDHAAAVALTEAGFEASHAVADAASLFPFLVTGTRARLAQSEPAAAQDWAEKVSADLRARGIPGTLPAVDHAAGLIQLAAGRTGKARDLLGSARAGGPRGTGGGRRSGAPLDLARCALASNRRTDARAPRGGAGRGGGDRLRPFWTPPRLGSRLDEHDAAQPWSPLTLRELEVARLVAQGMTNREIAASSGSPPGRPAPTSSTSGPSWA